METAAMTSTNVVGWEDVATRDGVTRVELVQLGEVFYPRLVRECGHRFVGNAYNSANDAALGGHRQARFACCRCAPAARQVKLARDVAQ